MVSSLRLTLTGLGGTLLEAWVGLISFYFLGVKEGGFGLVLGFFLFNRVMDILKGLFRWGVTE